MRSHTYIGRHRFVLRVNLPHLKRGRSKISAFESLSRIHNADDRVVLAYRDIGLDTTRLRITIDSHAIPVSASLYAVTYNYAGDANFLSAPMASTTLSVKYASVGVCGGDLGHTILQPINPNGTSVFNSKSTSPAKFRVCDANGVSVGTPGVVKTFVLYQIANGTTTTVNESVDSTTPDTTFRWDPSAQQWIFNISNKNLGPANQTYFFLITLNDGTTIPFSYGLK